MKTILTLTFFCLTACNTHNKLKIADHNKLPAASGHYSHAIIANNIIYTSGQLGIDPAKNQLAQGTANQLAQALENLTILLNQNNSTMTRVIKTTVLVTDANDLAEVNKIYGSFFKEHKPARTTIVVKALPKNASVEIECVAVIN